MKVRKIPRWLTEEVFDREYRLAHHERHWRRLGSLDADARAAIAGLAIPIWYRPDAPVTIDCNAHPLHIEVVGRDRYHHSFQTHGFIGPRDPAGDHGWYWSMSDVYELAPGQVEKPASDQVTLHVPYRFWVLADLRRYADVAAAQSHFGPRDYLGIWDAFSVR